MKIPAERQLQSWPQQFQLCRVPCDKGSGGGHPASVRVSSERASAPPGRIDVTAAICNHALPVIMGKHKNGISRQMFTQRIMTSEVVTCFIKPLSGLPPIYVLE